MIIKWVNYGQIIMQVNKKITYLLNELYRLIQFWPKPYYTQSNL